MEAWRRYQHDVADFYRSLGMTAKVDVAGYAGARTSHDIDVLVQTKIAGERIAWVVECKQWARPVPKERVLILQGIVADVGADRGILLCEKGFQAGAYRAAVAANITLTSLDDLRANTEAEREAASLQSITKRSAHAARRVSGLWPWATPLVPRGAFSVQEVLEVAAPSMELSSHVLPRLHTGESVQMFESLADHLSTGDQLGAAASLLTVVEARLDELEHQRATCAITAAQHFVSIEENASEFIDLISKPDRDSVAQQAVQAMRNISASVDEIRTSTPSPVGRALQRVMEHMLNSVYLLPERGADEQEREHARVTSRALLAQAQATLGEMTAGWHFARPPGSPDDTAGS